MKPVFEKFLFKVTSKFDFRFQNIGLYVVMFLEILGTLVKALSIFSILFIAFGLAFYILMGPKVSMQNDDILSQ